MRRLRGRAAATAREETDRMRLYLVRETTDTVSSERGSTKNNSPSCRRSLMTSRSRAQLRQCPSVSRNPRHTVKPNDYQNKTQKNPMFVVLHEDL